MKLQNLVKDKFYFFQNSFFPLFKENSGGGELNFTNRCSIGQRDEMVNFTNRCSIGQRDEMLSFTYRCSIGWCELTDNTCTSNISNWMMRNY